jgi:hypothetical protein
VQTLISADSDSPLILNGPVVKMKKLDLRKQLKYLYAPSAKKVEIVDVPSFNFAMIDGEIKHGETPGTSQD